MHSIPWGASQAAEHLLKLIQLKYPSFPTRVTASQSNVSLIEFLWFNVLTVFLQVDAAEFLRICSRLHGPSSHFERAIEFTCRRTHHSVPIRTADLRGENRGRVGKVGRKEEGARTEVTRDCCESPTRESMSYRHATSNPTHPIDLQLARKENDLSYLLQLREGKEDNKRTWAVRKLFSIFYTHLSCSKTSTPYKLKALMMTTHWTMQ